MSSRFYEEQLPYLQFFGLQDSKFLVPLRSPWFRQATNVEIFLAGRIDQDPTRDINSGTAFQEIGYHLEVWGYDGVAQDVASARTNLGSPINQLTHGGGGVGPNIIAETSQSANGAGVAHAGWTKFTMAEAFDYIHYPVTALQITKIFGDAGPLDPTQAGIPVFVTGRVLYEVECCDSADAPAPPPS